MGDIVHGPFEHLEAVIHSADVVLHLPDSVDTADKLAIVLEDQRLNLVIVDLDLLVDLVVTPDQLLYRVLLQHAEHVSLSIETSTVYVHLNQYNITQSYHTRKT